MIEQGSRSSNGPDPVTLAEAEGVEDMREFIGHTAWRAAPIVQVHVDTATDLLTVSCYVGIPDVEIDPNPLLSVGFHQYRQEFLMTSLCLYGVHSWPESPVAPAYGASDVVVAWGLIGESAAAAVTGLRGGGSGTIELPAQEVTGLTHRWREFVTRNTG